MGWQSGRRAVVAAAMAAVTGMGAPSVRAGDPTPAEMMQQIKQLQAKVDQLEAAQAKWAATTQPAGATASSPAASSSATGTASAAANTTSAAVQADADAHSRLFDITNPLTGGWNGNAFVLRSDDGSFTFEPHLLMDARNMTSYREKIPAKGGGNDTPNATGYDTQNGFDLTRLRLWFNGVAFQNITYFFQFSADQGSSLSLLDAFATYHIPNSPFGLKVGQFKDPVWHERNLSEAVLLGVDRSLVESLLGGGQTSRVQGAALTYEQGLVRAQAVIHDGFDSINTKFYDAGGLGAGVGSGAGVTPTNFGTSGRAEVMLIGKRTAQYNPFTEYEQFTALGDKQDILVLGGGLDYSQAGSNDVLFHSVDLQYDSTTGLSAFAAYLGSNRDIHANQGVSRPGVYYDAGFVVQAAYLIPDTHLEPFGRFDFTALAPHSVTGLSSHTAQELTLGTNYYIYGQHAKLTVDASWLPNGAPTDEDALGILRDSGHTEWLLRGQFQLEL